MDVGTLGAAVAMVKNAVAGQVSEQVEGAVDSWLEENITNPDSPPLDRSLSSSSSAAPADMVGDLKSAINSQVTTENLMGNEAGVLYPVNIAPGAKFTISSSDGQAFGQGGATQVQLIGSDGVTQYDYFSLVAGNTNRTVTTSSSKPTTYYLRWNQVPRVPMMVVMGETVKSYVPYIYPIRDYVKKIEGEIVDARTGIDSTVYSSLGEAIRRQISGVESEIEGIESSFTNVTFTKLYRATPVLTDGYYMGTNGVPVSNSDYAYTQKITVKPGDVVKLTKTNGAYDAKMRFVCAYNGNSAVSNKGSDTQITTYTVPTGIDGVIITTSQKTIDAIDVYRSEETLFANCKSDNMGFFKETGSLSDGGSLELPYENAKNNVVVCFSGRITSFSSITIGKYSSRRYVTITGTQITVNDGTNTYTESHGLTISNNVSVTIISNGKTNKVKQIDIESAGETYTFTNNSCFFEEENGHWSVISDGTEMTDCVLTFTSSNINNKLWMFGDSYFSINNDRWVYYLLQDDFTSPFINGYSGENAQTAIVGFKNLLSARVPENVLWCLGMNNGDTSSAVNATWLSIYNELVNLSKEYGFNLILATIPNTPTVNNSYKNMIVRESGYQYIDFAAAVNVGNDGSWISGALSTDNVHPTAKGAKILYRRALADCPQLASAE